MKSCRVPGAGGTRWEQGPLATALRRDRPDVLVRAGLQRAARPRRSAVSCHSRRLVSRAPGMVRPARRLAAAVSWRGRPRDARRRVLTVSEFSRDEIVRRLGIPADRVHVIRHGRRHPGAPPPRASRCVLFVGSIFNRRHVPSSSRPSRGSRPPARPATGARRQQPHASAAGPRRHWRSAAGIGGRVVVRDYVPDAALTRPVSRASVFAFLSEYEGFGLTPLEALAVGRAARRPRHRSRPGDLRRRGDSRPVSRRGAGRLGAG